LAIFEFNQPIKLIGDGETDSHGLLKYFAQDIF